MDASIVMTMRPNKLGPKADDSGMVLSLISPEEHEALSSLARTEKAPAPSGLLLLLRCGQRQTLRLLAPSVTVPL